MFKKLWNKLTKKKEILKPLTTRKDVIDEILREVQIACHTVCDIDQSNYHPLTIVNMILLEYTNSYKKQLEERMKAEKAAKEKPKVENVFKFDPSKRTDKKKTETYH